MQRRLSGQALRRLLGALRGCYSPGEAQLPPGAAPANLPATLSTQRLAWSSCACTHVPALQAPGAVAQWQAARAAWSTPRGPEVPPVAPVLPIAPPAMASGAGAEAAAINPLLQVPQPVRKPAEPGRGGKGKPAEKEKVGLAMLKNIHMSPKKLALWAKMVRGLHVEDAMIQCTVRVNKGAKILAETIHSARANAVNNFGLNPSKLVIGRAEVGHGSHRKRVWFHAKGRTGIRKKYFSHLWIEVKEGTKRRVTRLVKPLLERPRRRMPDIEAQRHSEAAVASRRHARIFRK